LYFNMLIAAKTVAAKGLLGYLSRFPAVANHLANRHPTSREIPMLRDDIKAALIGAMKARDERTVSTLRMVQAEIKNKDIEARVSGAPADDDVMVTDLLGKMVKKRRDSIELYEKGGRIDLADAERAEIEVIERFLPKMMTPDEARAVIAALVAEVGATSVKDMGKVMGALKARYTGQIDMGSANALVKAALEA